MHHRIDPSGKTVKILFAGLVVCSIISAIVISRGKAGPKLYRQSEFLLNTLVEITVASLNEQDAEQAISAAFEEMRRVEALLTRYRSDSQITRINQLAGEDQFVPVNREVRDILQRSLHYSVLMDGLFDITVGPLIDLWGIGTDHERIPEVSKLQQVLQQIDYRNVEIRDEQGVRLRYPEMTLDLGGIAKGYSIDRGIEVLQSHNITSALLNAGGDIRCIGTKPDGTPWRIGIRHPRKQNEILGVFELRDNAVATSGDYERFFVHQGIRYHHIFVPDTGMPARECQSVTILTDTAEKADVLATSVFIMGPQQGIAFIEEQTDVEGMIIRADGEIIQSSGFSFEAR